MATHPHMLLAYDEALDVVATLDYVVQYDLAGRPTGIIDFAAHEEAGGEMLEVWRIAGDNSEGGVVVPWTARGSKVWPEWIGGRAHDFRVELDGAPGQKRIVGLVHKRSGYRRDRAELEATIRGRIDEKVAEATAAGDALRATAGAQETAAELPEGDRVATLIPDPAPEPADIRDLVGGPDRPLMLDDDGRNVPWISLEEELAARPKLPVIGAALEPAPSVPGPALLDPVEASPPGIVVEAGPAEIAP